MQMTTGNFAHKKSCFSEKGIKWDEKILVGADWAFLNNFRQSYDMFCVPTIPVTALYRREHPYNLMNLTTAAAYGGEATDGELEKAKLVAEKMYYNKFLEQ
jgi:hypothetical protein